MSKVEQLTRTASQVRRDVIRMVANAKCGHPGGALGSADVLTALFFDEMKHDPSRWERSGKGNDMFFLSAGHMSAGLYSVLARSAYFPLSEMEGFRLYGRMLQGHPSVGIPGVYQASGSLGQGLAVGLGAAIGKKMAGDNHRVFVLCGDGECEEGEIWESAMFAAHHKVDNIVAMTDWNGNQIDGPVDSVMSLGDLEGKWKAFGWEVIVAEGNDMQSVLDAFSLAREKGGKGKPVMILWKTEMGHGVDFMTGSHEWHGKAPDAAQTEAALAQLPETLGDF